MMGLILVFKNINLTTLFGEHNTVHEYKSNDICLLHLLDIYTRYSIIFQEIEPRCGEALCRLFESDENIDLKAIALKAKHARRRAQIERQTMFKDQPPTGSSMDRKPPPPPHSNNRNFQQPGPARLGLFQHLYVALCA